MIRLTKSFLIMAFYFIQSRLIRSYSRTRFSTLRPSSGSVLRVRDLLLKSTRAKPMQHYEYRLSSISSPNASTAQSEASQKKDKLSSGRMSPAYESNPSSAEYNEFIKCIKFKDFEGLKTLYHRNKAIGLLPMKPRTYNSILVVCQDAEHLSLALEVFEDMMSMEVPPVESTFLPLIRCYCNSGDVLTSLNLIKQMRDIGLEPKLRTYQPVLDKLCEVCIPILELESGLTNYFIRRLATLIR
jgi:pentatricopeptide repeat protein